MCERCETRLAEDLHWLSANLDSLERYRVNRAYGKDPRSGGGGGDGTASAPVRASIFSLLWERDDEGYPGIGLTLGEWMRCLDLPMQGRSLAEKCDWILASAATGSSYLDNPATPVYARQLHPLRVRAQRLMEHDGGERVILGVCPIDGCGMQLSAPVGAESVTCRRCRSQWDTGFLRIARRRRLMESGYVGTQQELRDLLASCGIAVKASTMRSWVHRGRLRQHGENERSSPTYRLADAYRLAVRDLPESSESIEAQTNIWELIAGGA